MKCFFGARSWRLVISVVIILVVSQQSFATEEDEEAAAGVEEGGEEHLHHEHGIEESSGEHKHIHDHEDDHSDHGDHGGGGEEVVLSAEVSSDLDEHHHHDHHDHQPVVRGHGESCGEIDGGGTCDTGAGLVCADEKCECDKNAGEVFSLELGKCEQAPSQDIGEVHDNSLEQDAEASKEEAEDEGVKNEEEENSPTTTSTTTTTEATIKANSAEEEEQPEMEIQHRADDDEDDKEESGEIGAAAAGGKCASVNCEEVLGRYSKCDEETGDCQCNDVEGQNRALVLRNSQCIINRQINDPCTGHDECTATIAGKAWCHMDMVTKSRFCQCEMFHYYDDSLKECLPLASNGVFSPCKTDMQCTGFQVDITGHGLGPHARCSQEKGRCECKMGPDGQKSFLYENYCFYQMMPGERCDIDRECEVSFPAQNVGCLEGKCMCKSGENITAVSCPSDKILGGSKRVDGMFEDEMIVAKEEEDGVLDNLKSAMGLDLPNFAFVMIIGAVVLLAVVILSVLVVKKRHKYSMVRTREPTEEPASP